VVWVTAGAEQTGAGLLFLCWASLPILSTRLSKAIKRLSLDGSLGLDGLHIVRPADVAPGEP